MRAVEFALDALPEAHPPRLDDHAPARRRQLREVGLADDGLIPFGKIFGARDLKRMHGRAFPFGGVWIDCAAAGTMRSNGRGGARPASFFSIAPSRLSAVRDSAPARNSSVEHTIKTKVAEIAAKFAPTGHHAHGLEIADRHGPNRSLRFAALFVAVPDGDLAASVNPSAQLRGVQTDPAGWPGPTACRPKAPECRAGAGPARPREFWP